MQGNGIVYEGKWLNDNISEGTETYPNGDIYIGEFYKGKRHG